MSTTATVYFASNRKLTGAADQVTSYGPDIQPPSVTTDLVYGTAFVSGIDIPTNTPGKIDSLQNVAIGQFVPDPAGDLAGAGRDLLVFLHGFDNSFEDAITRAAFNREWFAASGVANANTTVIAFSWPSLGQIVSFPILPEDYLRDQKMARNSGVHLMAFFATIAPLLSQARSAGRRTFLLAHSMGNLALENMVESWFMHGKSGTRLFNAAVLAAGDCNYNAFGLPHLAGLGGLSQLADRVAVYYSGADQVLQLSFVVNLGAQRLGQDGPHHRADTAAFPPAQFRMVDASGFRDYAFDFLTSHQYYRMSPAARASIVSDMT